MTWPLVDREDRDDAAGDGGDPGGQAVQTITEVDRVGDPDHPQDRQQPAPFAQGQDPLVRHGDVGDPNAHEAQHERHQQLRQEFHAGRQALEVVHQADGEDQGRRAEQREQLQSRGPEGLADIVVDEDDRDDQDHRRQEDRHAADSRDRQRVHGPDAGPVDCSDPPGQPDHDRRGQQRQHQRTEIDAQIGSHFTSEGKNGLPYDGQGGFLRDRICTTFLTGPADQHGLVVVGLDRVLGLAEVRLHRRNELVEPGLFSSSLTARWRSAFPKKDYNGNYNF